MRGSGGGAGGAKRSWPDAARLHVVAQHAARLTLRPSAGPTSIDDGTLGSRGALALAFPRRSWRLLALLLGSLPLRRGSRLLPLTSSRTAPILAAIVSPRKFIVTR